MLVHLKNPPAVASKQDAVLKKIEDSTGGLTNVSTTSLHLITFTLRRAGGLEKALKALLRAGFKAEKKEGGCAYILITHEE